MKKMLMLASVASMIDQFNMSNIEILQDMGYEVHVAANFEQGNTSSKERVEKFKNELELLNIPYFQIDFERNVTKIGANIKAYKQIVKLIIDNNYEFIHCHSPIGGVCGRLAAHKTNTRVIYTAHGFHFFKGAPLKNWLIYYSIEKWLSKYTDILITINKEDYTRAKKSFKAGCIDYVPGVGIDVDKFYEVEIDKSAKRKEIGVPTDAFVILSVGELNTNKNHEIIIKSIAKLNKPNIFYIICGQGPLENYLKDLSKELGIEKQLKLLGFRRDIPEICKASDVFAFPSKREGLGLAALEAMASGLPIITSNVHGIVDYSVNGVTGYCCNPTDVDSFSEGIKKLKDNDKLRNVIKFHNMEIVNKFDKKYVKNDIMKIYSQVNNDIT